MIDKIKVLLADDHQMFIDGLKAVLSKEESVTVVGEALDGVEVLTLMEKNEVDVVVLDINMPKLDGIETAKVIKLKYPGTKVLILTMFNQKDFVMKLMDIGVAGYILKNKSTEQLMMGINNVYQGNSHYGLDILNIIATSSTKKEEEVQITEREKEVLCQIAEGHTSKEISIHLKISVTTVNTHRRNLLHKLELPNDKHLVRYAIKMGFINLE